MKNDAHQTGASTCSEEPVVAADTRMVPTTALPWKKPLVYAYEGDTPWWLIPDVAQDMSEGDAAYTVHTANAYPKLVAALRAYFAYVPQDGCAALQPLDRHAESLLSELGEL